MQEFEIWKFQSTSPVRGTTQGETNLIGIHVISIHVPREGDDSCRGLVVPGMTSFQSTSPVRGTTVEERKRCGKESFQSTSPVRGTTRGDKVPAVHVGISIHVPREGDDRRVRLLEP